MQVRFIVAYIINIQLRITKIGVSENRGPESTTLNRRILIIRTLKYDTPHFRKLTYCSVCVLLCTSIQNKFKVAGSLEPPIDPDPAGPYRRRLKLYSGALGRLCG